MKLLAWLGLGYVMNLRCDRCRKPMKDWDGESLPGYVMPLCEQCQIDLKA